MPEATGGTVAVGECPRTTGRTGRTEGELPGERVYTDEQCYGMLTFDSINTVMCKAAIITMTTRVMGIKVISQNA